MMNPMQTTNFPTLTLFRRGKVRDVYDLGDVLLIVATDRISAFDVVMDTPITGKGAILTALSSFWFDKTTHIIKNHIVRTNPVEYPKECLPYIDQLQGRSMLVIKTKPLPIECVVRGYLAGSGWKEYQSTSTICGITLPPGLSESQQLPSPIFTPATKAEEGHDENITLVEAIHLCGEFALQAKDISMKLYDFAYQYAAKRGIILADTKFEFGVDSQGELILIDEALTPDSSRYWLQESYHIGKTQENLDKQVLRDYLETLDWNKQYPSPPLPNEIVQAIIAKYQLALDYLIT